MKILYILKHNPWGVGGGCVACHNYLQLFSTLYGDAEIDACICEEYLAQGRTEEFPNVRFIGVGKRGMAARIGGVLTGVLHRHQRVARRLLASGGYDLCIFDHNSIAGTLCDDCRRRGVKTVVLNHNCEQDYFRDNHGALMNLVVLPWVRRAELKAYRTCDCNLFLTEEDCEQFAALYGPSATRSIVGGCFYAKDYLTADGGMVPLRREAPRMVISGTMSNVQNLDGLRYFLDRLLPRVPDDITVVMAGKNPPEEIRQRVEQEQGRIVLVPNPKDMDAVVRQCDIFLCPARLGGGMKLRVMDGLRNGLPVLTHSVSARGYREFARRGVLWEFQDGEEFGQQLADILARLREGTLSREQVTEAAREVLSFDAALERIKNQTKELCIDE